MTTIIAAVLVMDVWEHAFLLDYKAAERPKYIEACLSNIDWKAVDSACKKVRPQRAKREYIFQAIGK